MNPSLECIKNENPQDHLLLDAIKSGASISRFMDLLVAGANVNAQFSEQGNGFKVKTDSSLHLAARFKGEQPEYTRLLLENGADVFCVNEKGRTPLFQACLEGAEDVCALLIKNGSRLDTKDNDGMLTFELMLVRFDVQVIRNLIQAMDGSQTQCALDCTNAVLRKLEVFEDQKKSNKPGRLRISTDGKLSQLSLYGKGPATLPERFTSALAILQSRQAMIAMESVEFLIHPAVSQGQKH